MILRLITRSLQISFFLVLGMNVKAQTNYYVSATSGSNNNNGKSPGAPLATIQRAANLVQPGETIYIMEGTYREKVVINKNGEPGAPITFQAYNNEKVIVSTCNLVTGWTAASGDINQNGTPDSDVWKASMDWDAGEDSPASDQSRWADPNNPATNNTMFVDGVLRYVAREKAESNPVYLDNWGIIPDRALKHEGFTAPELAGWGDDFWNGAKICHHTSDWSSNYSVIADYRSSDGTVTFERPLTYFPSQKQRFGYYIFGTIKALDKAHEWYKESGSNTIYYKVKPGVNPNDREIEMKKRDFTFDLQGANYIIIKNIIHRGGGPTSSTPCTGFIFQGNEVYGLGENGYGHLRIYGDSVQIRDNYFRQSFGSVMGIGGDRWDIVNNKFEDISYHIPASGIDIDNNSTRFLISYNTFSGLGRGAFHFYPLESIISYNLFEKFCRNSWDTAAIDGDTSGGQGGGSLVHHNVFRDSPQYNRRERGTGSNGSGFAGLYSGLELTVYRNIFLDVGTEPIVNCRLNFHNFYHNTFVTHEPKVDISNSVESSYLNNLQVSMDKIVTPKFIIKGNINYAASDFVDLKANDVRLSAESSAIDKGILIAGINDDYAGSAPDVGALEYGESLWKVGYDSISPATVTYDYSPPIGANIIGDGGFTSTSRWKFVGNASVYNPNTWNYGALGLYGTNSLRLLRDGLIESTFDNLEPNKTYLLGAEARLVYSAIKANNYTLLQGTASTGKHRGENYITGLDEGESVAYKDIDFGDGTLFDHAEVTFARQSTLTPEQGTRNSLELRIGSPKGALLATLQYRSGVADSWEWTSSQMQTFPKGKKTVCLVPKGPESGGMRINSVRFFKEKIDARNQLIMGVEGHGYNREISFIGKGDWIHRYEEMLFRTGNSIEGVKIFFEYSGPYEVYVSRVFLKKVEDYKNIAPLGTSLQSSTKNGNPSIRAHDGKRDDNSAITKQESSSFWQMKLPKASSLKGLRISSANTENSLKNVRVSLGNNDPRLGGTPLLSRDYKITYEDLNNGKSLYISVYEWIKDELATNVIPFVNYIRVERLDDEKLSLSEVEAITFDTDVDEFAEVTKNVDEWKYTFAYDINPTLLTVINSDISELEGMRIVVQNKGGNTVWEKVYEGNMFHLPKNDRYEIPGNELSDDGRTRLASVLGRSISVEKVGNNFNLKDFKVFDGSQVAPEGNLAILGNATQSSNHYRDQGFAGNANNGYIFPNNDFTTTSKSDKPWWELELEQLTNVDQIVLWNRNPEAAANRIGNFKVSVLDGSRTTIWSQDYSYSNGDLAEGKSLTIDTDHNDARYVRVQCSSSSTFLHLAEVQVWPKNEESLVRTLPLQKTYNFDVGPVNQKVESRWIGINPMTTGDVWWSNRPNGLDRGTSTRTNDVNRDFVSASSPSTLNVRIPNGEWRLKITTGDAINSLDGFHLTAEDVVIADNVSTTANGFTTFTKNVTVNDGVLNLSVSDVRGADLTWVLNSLTIDNNITSIHGLKQKSNNIIVYPNPAQENVHIHFKDIKEVQRVVLINMLGQVVKHYPLLANRDSYSLSGLQTGIYFVKMYIDGRVRTKKLVKSE